MDLNVLHASNGQAIHNLRKWRKNKLEEELRKARAKPEYRAPFSVEARARLTSLKTK